ncbi:MAG: hypothetical protein KME17_11630 [Cyanosarcina radialis HA8281-LM2]|jgi:acyl-CoA synthetase (NDP forming)|nr:hypothetical protein [Cyanosarcina radialis HA8281-LM2]
MATIFIDDLNPTGYLLFADDESYLRDLSSSNELNAYGGILVISIPSPAITPTIISPLSSISPMPIIR